MKASKKETLNNSNKEFVISIPTSVLKDRTLSVLEALVEFLKDVKKLTYHEIGVIINRDERNIWTVYHRAKKKRINEKKK